MFSKRRQFASFALHRSMPHVRRAYRPNQINFYVLLQNCEDLCFAGIRRRNVRIGRWRSLRFIGWIELKTMVGGRKMLCESV
jgi:hypothetical protein